VSAKFKVTADRRELRFSHVRVRGVDLIDDEQRPSKGGTPQMGESHLEATKGNLIDRSDCHTRSEVTGRMLCRPAVGHVRAVVPKNLEVRQSRPFGFSGNGLAGNCKYRFGRLLEHPAQRMIDAPV
jgi:hypothetical protein